MHVVVALARALALALAGATVGVAAVAVHDLTTGLVLGLAATAAAGYALPGGWTWRLPFLVGWAVVVLRAAVPTGSGSYLVADDRQGYTLLIAAVVLLVLGVVTTRPRASRPAADAESDPPVS